MLVHVDRRLGSSSSDSWDECVLVGGSDPTLVSCCATSPSAHSFDNTWSQKPYSSASEVHQFLSLSTDDPTEANEIERKLKGVLTMTRRHCIVKMCPESRTNGFLDLFLVRYGILHRTRHRCLYVAWPLDQSRLSINHGSIVQHEKTDAVTLNV